MFPHLTVSAGLSSHICHLLRDPWGKSIGDGKSSTTPAPLFRQHWKPETFLKKVSPMIKAQASSSNSGPQGWCMDFPPGPVLNCVGSKLHNMEVYFNIYFLHIRGTNSLYNI